MLDMKMHSSQMDWILDSQSTAKSNHRCLESVGVEFGCKQECIPVGYVPPACWPYSSMHCGWGAGTGPEGVPAQGGVPAEGCICLGCVPAQGGVPAWGVPAQGCTYPGGVPARGCTCLGGVPTWGIVYLPSGWSTCLGGWVYLSGGTCPVHPPVNRMTDRQV